MASPSFIAADTGVGGTANLTVGSVTGQAGDIEFLHVMVRDTTNAPTTPTGFTLVGGPYTLGSTATGRMWLYGQIWAGAPSTYTITIGGTSGKYARRYIYRDGNGGSYSDTIASNIEALGFRQGITSSTAQIVNVTTTVADALILAYVAVTDDANPFTPSVDWTETVAEFASAAGTDGTIGAYHKVAATAGLYASGSIDVTASDPLATVAFALKPATGGGGTPSDVYPAYIGGGYYG